MKIIRLFPVLAALAFSFAAFFPVVSQASADSSSPPAQFVQKLGDKALTSLTASGLPAPERAKRVRALLRDHFDIRTIGRFALGTYWAEMTESQRRAYFGLFEDMLVQTYTGRFADYSGQSFKVTGVSSPAESARDFIVSSQILQSGGGVPLSVDWRVRGAGSQFMIVDVLVDGISMSVTQRSDFDAVIQHGGGKVDSLLVSLKDHRG